jgi:hypothetical protein
MRRVRSLFASGRFWMWWWTGVLAVMAVWAVLTVAFWMDSVRNINALSIAAILLAPAGGFQATLAMRKADADDPL